MHQYTHQCAFTPIPHQSSTGLPAPAMMGAQDSNFIQHLLRGRTRPSSLTPVTAFRRVTQKSFKPTKQGRWSAMHVCIAWKIYYHKQHKKMQLKPDSLHQELTTRRPETLQHEEPDQQSCIQPNLDSTYGQSTYGERSETGKTTENRSHFQKCPPSDFYTSSCHIQTIKRDKLGQLLNLNSKEKIDEKEEHKHQQLDSCSNVLLLKEKSQGHTVVTPELNGRHDTVSYDKKRPLECGSFLNMKRVKQEVVDDQSDPSLLSTPHADLSSHTTLVQHINTSDSALYCYSSGHNVARTPTRVVSYPGAEMYPHQTASWEQMWTGLKTVDQSLRRQLLGDYLLNSCKVVKMPHAAQKHKEVFHALSAPHLHFPFAMRQQETAYLSRRKLMSSGNESHHLHHSRHHHYHSATMSHLLHPGLLAASYTG